MTPIIKVCKGDWLQLPSGRMIEVRKVIGDSNPDVEVRYLDEDGTRATGSFFLRLSFLLANGRKVGA